MKTEKGKRMRVVVKAASVGTGQLIRSNKKDKQGVDLRRLILLT